MRIIGIAGTNGSGKDTISHFLAEKGWLFVSASADLIIPELRRRGLPLEREQMSALSAEWNRNISKGAIVDKALEHFNKLSENNAYKGLVISSIRHPWEVDKIHAHGGQVIWVDADPHVRYDRIYSRGQGDKDRKTFEQFLAEEQAEMTHSGDEATLSMAAVKDKADVKMENSGTIEEFQDQIQQKLSLA